MTSYPFFGGFRYPIVVKPARGAGCRGVALVRNGRELCQAIDVARDRRGKGAVLLQQYVAGAAASVSLLSDGSRSVALSVNGQAIRTLHAFSYRGGRVPFDHPLATRAAATAIRACEALPGLRGYVGVDLVLTRSEAIVIEVNPRLTTAYVGVRSALDANVADLALSACAGILPVPPPVRRHVRFTAGGRIVSTTPVIAPSSARSAKPTARTGQGAGYQARRPWLVS